jgi:hypothetical protein
MRAGCGDKAISNWQLAIGKTETLPLIHTDDTDQLCCIKGWLIRDPRFVSAFISGKVLVLLIVFSIC